MHAPRIQRREVFSPKHVWVNTQVMNTERALGILLEWQTVGDGPWRGLVVYTHRRIAAVCQRASGRFALSGVEAARISEV